MKLYKRVYWQVILSSQVLGDYRELQSFTHIMIAIKYSL